MYDVIIIGAGPAGISAGIYAVSRGQKALILEKKSGRRTDSKSVRCHTLCGNCRGGNRGKLCKAPEETGGKCRGRNPEDRGEKSRIDRGGKKDLYRERMLLCEEGNFSEWYIDRKSVV